jgi:hypothetical protein
VDFKAAPSLGGCIPARVCHHVVSRSCANHGTYTCSLDPIRAGVVKAQRQAEEEKSGAILRRMRERVKQVAKLRAAKLQKQRALDTVAMLSSETNNAGETDFASSEWDTDDVTSMTSALSLSHMRGPAPRATNSPGPTTSSPVSIRSDKSTGRQVLSSVL